MSKQDNVVQAWKDAMNARGTWLQRASCVGLWDFFDVDEGDLTINGITLKTLEKICAECPVFQECLNDTMFFADEYTFRAGMLPTHRRKLMRKIGELSWDKKQEVLRGYGPKKRDFT